MHQELESLKVKVKENISVLINNNQLLEAKSLIREYKKMVSNDIEIYSIEAVILMMEDRIKEAEILLKEGLAKDSYNEDLLFNMSYLMSSNGNFIKSVEYFSKAKLFNNNSNVKLNDIIPFIGQIKEDKLKVINGTIEIANQMSTITKGLKNMGIEAKTLNYYPNYLGYKSDFTLNLENFSNLNEANIEIKKIASKLIPENDVFHFHFGSCLTLDYSDLSLLNELGKKVIMQYWGTDVRMYSKAIKLNPYIKVKDMDEDSIKRRLEFISKYIPNCLVVDNELAEYVKDYHSNIHYTRVAIDLNKYRYIEKTFNEKLLIVHAPTNAEYKGTSYILKAIEDLKSQYNFDFQLVQGMKHEEAMKIYEKADIIIDQILGGGYGVFAVEAMAMGKPVICWISDFMKEKYPEELPIISANPDSIKEKIEYAIKNKDMLQSIGLQGRKYVEKYHDMNIISKNIYGIYKKL